MLKYRDIELFTVRDYVKNCTKTHNPDRDLKNKII